MNKNILNNIISLILAFIFIAIFGSIIVGLIYYVITHFSFTILISCLLAASIPGLLLYSGICATIDFIKKDILRKK